MAQRTKIHDLTRSYIPIDPNTLLETMHATEREDAPEQRFPVIPYEGWNFMPSGYGYKSYFGLTAKLDIDVLTNTAKIRDAFVFQKADLSNMLVVLKDDGIWTKQGETSGAWNQAVALVDPNDGTVREWSWCVIQNVLYVYRQGEASVYVCQAPGYAFVASVPTTLNMAGQLGIFKAGGRLGFWDSSNSVANSAFENKMDVTPSIGTGANIFTVNDVIGKIINIVQHGEGWIVYATKSIVGLVKDVESTFKWRAIVISNVAGISYRRQVATAAPDSIHYVWTSIGLMRIENFKAEIIAPELYDYLKESQSPVYLKFMEGRYLAVMTSDSDHIDGSVSFYTHTVPPTTLNFPQIEIAVDEFIPGMTAQEASQKLATIEKHIGHLVALDNSPAGVCDPSAAGYCTGKYYPYFSDFIRLKATAINPNTLATFQTLWNKIAAGGELSEISGARDDFAFTYAQSMALTLFQNDIYPQLNGTAELRKVVADTVIDTLTNSGDQLDLIDTVNLRRQPLTFSRMQAFTEGLNRFYDAWLRKLDELLDPWHNTRGSSRRGTENQAIFGALTCMFPDLETMKNNSGSVLGDISFIINQNTIDGAGLLNDDYTDNSKLFAMSDTSGYKFNVKIKHGLVCEYGIKDSRIPFVIARATKESIRELRYKNNKTRKRLQVYIAVTPGQAIGAYAGYNPTPIFCRTDAQFKAALASFVSGAAAYSGKPGTRLEYNLSGSNRATINNAGAAWLQDTFNGHTSRLYITPGDGTAATNQSMLEVVANWAETSDEREYVKSTNNPANFCASPVVLEMTSFPYSYYRYLADGSTEDVPLIEAEPPERANIAAIMAGLTAGSSVCGVFSGSAAPLFNFIPFNFSTWKDIPTSYTVTHNGNSINVNYEITQEEFSFTFPGATFQMQVGAPVPYDILFKGAFFYDTHLKRWGKMKNDYRELLDFSPINSTAVGTIPFTYFGVQGALINNAGEIRMFDSIPTDSYLKWGKIGLFRQGFTTLETVRADMRQPCTFSMEVETSIDGRSVEMGLTKTFNFTDSRQAIQGIDNSGRWHNIGFRGMFDLQYLESNSWISSRR